MRKNRCRCCCRISGRFRLSHANPQAKCIDIDKESASTSVSACNKYLEAIIVIVRFLSSGILIAFRGPFTIVPDYWTIVEQWGGIIMIIFGLSHIMSRQSPLCGFGQRSLTAKDQVVQRGKRAESNDRSSFVSLNSKLNIRRCVPSLFMSLDLELGGRTRSMGGRTTYRCNNPIRESRLGAGGGRDLIRGIRQEVQNVEAADGASAVKALRQLPVQAGFSNVR